VPPRHGRVVEAHVGGEAAADPRPLALEPDDAHGVAVAPGEELAALAQHVAGDGGERVALLGGGRVGLAAEASGGEQRGSREARAAAAGAVGQLVGRGQRHDVPALLATERAGPGQRP
jgi:hypothetical protein